VGGEYGLIRKEESILLRLVLTYPDLYEIGMSNLAVKILYNYLNRLEGVSCERVFAPDRDFEHELRSHGIPLYSLETYTPLKDFDIFCVSLGYELTYTNILNMLDLGGISLSVGDRGENDPIVLAGGPTITNPIPIGRYVDCVYVGEAEGEILSIFSRLRELKRNGGGRRDLLSVLKEHPAIWSRDKASIARRTIWEGFGDSSISTIFPVPTIRIVQNHGIVEIMRGCPHGCRFCHAGIYYRPYRMKRAAVVLQEIETLVRSCGYREVTLCSLSSGDYHHIDRLVAMLNTRYREIGISFSLPSLRVDTFTLPILKELQEVRKSGLTFAVETPKPSWQEGINKLVSLEKTVRILREISMLGWNKAKFYFMVGLPVSRDEDEAEPIVEFLRTIQKETGITVHVNIACFIPKPHTPFQWEQQISEMDGLSRIMHIRRYLKGKRFKVTYHAPFTSVLEGVMARGDERVGDIIYRAFQKGARLDAWEEHIDWSLWRGVFAESDWDVIGETLRARSVDEPLPWDSVDTGVTKAFLLKELERSSKRKTSPTCSDPCSSFCGVCNNRRRVRKNTDVENLELHPLRVECRAPRSLLLSFTKDEGALFCSHLDTLTVLDRSFLRAGYHLRLTQGFNPKPRIEFANPLSLGIGSDEEIIRVEVLNFDGEDCFIDSVNNSLPKGFRIKRSIGIEGRKGEGKKSSLMSLFWGSDYLIWNAESDEFNEKLYQTLMRKKNENTGALDASGGGPIDFIRLAGCGVELRLKRSEKGGYGILKILTLLLGYNPLHRSLSVRRKATWASAASGDPVSYFDLFSSSSFLI
jgi:radical SAM superfamily enzyme YgiQ (UPF0313 family)